ncbi:MAG: hypothetical protein SVR81_10850 [Chloroflexota bacterium]|nr:hypothetical protein [Chloroflexota bacterium]
MRLLNLYLDKVRQYLPPRNREDIVKEIRSTLMDMIEDRNPNPGSEPGEATISVVLKEFGSPRQVARQFGAQNYLVGPRLFPIYAMVLRIILVVVAGANVLGLIVSLISQTGLDGSLAGVIFEIVGGLFSSLFAAFGGVTLIFAVIEHALPNEFDVDFEEEWQPEDLLKHEDYQQVKITEMAFDITFSMIFIVLINFFLDKIAIYSLGANGWQSLPILNENFLRYTPWITAYVVFDIILELFLIRKGYWTKTLVGLKALNNIFKIAVNFVLITGPAVITIDPAGWQALNFDLSLTAGSLTHYMNLGLDIILGLSIIGFVVDTIKRLIDGFIKDGQTKIDIPTE